MCKHHNPAVTNDDWCIVLPNDPKGNLLTAGFSIVGPFDTLTRACAWAESNITDTVHDNPHWVVMPMTDIYQA